MSEEILRRELEDAFRNRAHLYRLMLDELSAELGPAKAEKLLTRVVERRGREMAETLFAGTERRAERIGGRFLEVSPDGGRMYPYDLERLPDGMTIHVRRCPLKDAWIEAGLEGDRVAALCRIAGAFDKGLFEAAGVRFRNETWTPARGGGCCRIMLRDPA